MPNISELVRNQHDLLEEAKQRSVNLSLSKSSREFALREVRRLEAELGVEPAELVKAQPVETPRQVQFKLDKAEARRFIIERANALGWFKPGDKLRLTKQGDKEALSALIGFNTGLVAAGGEGRNIGTICFLASIRGVDAVLLDPID